MYYIFLEKHQNGITFISFSSLNYNFCLCISSKNTLTLAIRMCSADCLSLSWPFLPQNNKNCAYG